MNGTHNNIKTIQSLTPQEHLDDAFFRCSQAKGLATLLSCIEDHELASRGVINLATVLIELMDDSIENLLRIQKALPK